MAAGFGGDAFFGGAFLAGASSSELESSEEDSAGFATGLKGLKFEISFSSTQPTYSLFNYTVAELSNHGHYQWKIRLNVNGFINSPGQL